MLERGEAEFCREVVGSILGQHLGEVEFMTGTKRLREATP
jgi:hypothetical protein